MTCVLVTGGAGYIGSQTAKALAASGFEPVVLDNLSTGHRWAVRWGPLIEGELADIDVLRGLLRQYSIESVIHFAASTRVGESMRDPGKYFRNNVANTLNLLDAMVEASIVPIVFSSTCATYGIPESSLVSEEHPQRPINPYGESKLFVERILERYGEAYGLRWVALRYFNAAGADPDGELGPEGDQEAALIPLAIEAALGERPALEIFGTDYPTPDGTGIRDYVHVADLASAHVSALRYLIKGGDSVALNLGTGRGYSVREVLRSVEQVNGRSVPIHDSPRRAGDPPAVVADPSRATELLGWRPEHSSLDDIVRSAWRWHTARMPSI